MPNVSSLDIVSLHWKPKCERAHRTSDIRSSCQQRPQMMADSIFTYGTEVARIETAIEALLRRIPHEKPDQVLDSSKLNSSSVLS